MIIAVDVLLQLRQVLRLSGEPVTPLAEYRDNVVVLPARQDKYLQVLVIFIDIPENGRMTQVVDLQHDQVYVVIVQNVDGLFRVFRKKALSLVQVQILIDLFLHFNVLVNE